MNITQANHVWCADITYIPMRKGFLYLVAIMDWTTRRVLSWRLSNTLDADFCVEALNEAISRFGPPKIFNTDQGSQFTSFKWTDALRQAGIGKWIEFYNVRRPHTVHNGLTPDAAYWTNRHRQETDQAMQRVA